MARRGARASRRLNALGLPGVKFEPETYTPRSIPGVAASPRFAGKSINGVRVVVTDVARIEPLEIGMHVLAALVAEARAKDVDRLFPKLAMFHAIAGTKRLHSMLTAGSDGAAIIAAWQAEDLARGDLSRPRCTVIPASMITAKRALIEGRDLTRERLTGWSRAVGPTSGMTVITVASQASG